MRELLFRSQDRLAILFGCAVEQRPSIVASMLQRGPSEVTGYWAQLLIAAGIATLGLVLGSTAVIIGAMLVAPLMGPILGLGMGLATGSPVLVLRSAARVVASVGAAAAMSAVLSRFLPFHQVNAEIAARTSPTALDLGTAVFCAMAGVFAAMRPSSDVATTAAGTSIGISLVPPLCVCGYGLGTGAPSIAYGAGLLFLTNFSAIIFVGSLGFAAAGFGQIDVAEVERIDLDKTPGALLAKAPARRITRVLRSFGGPFLRLAMPVVLIAALYTPLRRGLDEVAWQITARDDVASAIGTIPHRVVQSTVVVERKQVRVVLFMLGSGAEALAARDQLVRAISEATGVPPLVEVHAVPDATDFEALERATKPPEAPAAVTPAAAPEAAPPEPTPGELLESATAAIIAAVEGRWPAAAGLLLRVDIGAEGPPWRIRLVYAGSELDDVTTELLEDTLAGDLGAELVIELQEIPLQPLSLDTVDPSLLRELAVLVERSRPFEQISICFTTPPPSPRRRAMEETVMRGSVEAIVLSHPRVTRLEAARPEVRFTTGGCVAASTVP